ncbi:MAG: MFS transporter [Gammaproteobacteria bacterium]|nr:MFS transporter [Gammaproteobacteria bacterium]
MQLKDYLTIFTNRRVGVVLLLGFSSGLPLALSGGTLQAWMTTAGVDLKTIGIFTLVGVPYTLKFLWAPFMDRFVPPWLGRRRGWMVATQVALMLGIAAMGLGSPQHALWALAALAMFVAFTSASQDIAFDAYRADVLRPAERGAGAAVSVMGYRIAMLVSGAGALIMADYFGWHTTYLILAGLMIVGVLATLLGPEPDGHIAPPRTLQEAVTGPFKAFVSLHSLTGAAWILLLIVLYKLGDAFAGTLSTAFLLRGVGFSLSEVGAVNKGLGLFALIAGALFGGALLPKLGLYRALMLFGVLQAVSNLSFMLLAWVGKSYTMLVIAVVFEQVSGGMGTAAFVALLMALCDHRYTATQFALFSAFSAFGRQYLGPPAGLLADELGWVIFFFITTLAALPGLWLLWRMRTRILRLDGG